MIWDFRSKREDLSGPAIKEIAEREGYQVVSMDILPDDRAMLSRRMAEIADENQAELILTTGGTGFPRGMLCRRPPKISQNVRFGNPGSHPRLQHDDHKTRHAQPRHSRNPEKDSDH